MIKVQINGKRVELDGPTTLLAYLEGIGVDFRAVAVEYNGLIVERAGYDRVRFQDGDLVEIVRMVGGGASATQDPATNLSRIASSASARSSHGS